MRPKSLPPIHPGEILKVDFLDALEISQYRLAKAMHVPPRRINEIVQGKRGISADTALRLSKALGTSAGFWMNLQSRFDIETAEDEIELAEIERLTA